MSLARRAAVLAAVLLLEAIAGGAPAPPAGSIDPAEEVGFSVSLSLPSADALDAYLAGLATPGAADYRRFLRPTEFAQRFGPPAADVERVAGWLRAGGLAVDVAPQHTSIAARGPAARVEQLLGISLVNRITPDGRRYHAPLGELVIPSKVRAAVAAIVGLDSEPLLRPALGGGMLAGVPAEGLTPSVVARAYEIEPLYAAGLHGEGQTVAIVSFDTFTPEDLDRFDSQLGIQSQPVDIVRLPGASTTAGSDTVEVSLDIQVIRGMAPAAQIINYEAPNNLDGFTGVIARIVADGRADIVNISWGLCERYRSTEMVEALDRELAAAYAAGISIFVAAGDDGAYDCRRVDVYDDPFERDMSVQVDFPSSSANVISVGGTYLAVRTDGSYLGEAGWEEPLGGGGGGGGLSTLFERPVWQTGTGVDNADSNGMRQLPDVAGPADPASGFFVTFSDPDQGVVNARIGGTSAAAPFWAAIAALTRQLANGAGIESVGALGPLLYQVAAEHPPGAVFHDIGRGGNLLYTAGSGWDYSTGLGTPRVDPLAHAIVDALSR
jgi:subtilase family serine protease